MPHKYLAMLVLLILPLGQGMADELSAKRQTELRHLVRQDCGACHGMTLKGGLGPALTRDAIAGKPRGAMLATLLHGRPGTPMPPWENLLTRQEAEWIIDQLYQGMGK
jgi:cytochrome c55X